jgi:hypothetical protein
LPRSALEEAQLLWEQGQHGPAVVLAQSTVENYFQSAVAALFALRGVGPLGNAITDALRGTSLGRTEHRAIHEALSGDSLTEGAFWPHYDTGRRRRNDWVHGFREISEREAEEFILAVVDLVCHVERVLKDAGVKDRYRITKKNEAGRLELVITPLDEEEEPVSITIEPKFGSADDEQ